MMNTTKIIGSFILFGLLSNIHVRGQGCVLPLGMEDGRIKDSQITASSVIKGRTAFPWLARLNRNIRPDKTGGKITEKNYDQYIEIDLLNLTKITGIATQGRLYSGGREYAEDYKISYRRDGGIWYFYGGKDQTVKIFKENTDVKTVVRHDLDPVIMARFIRVHPGYYPANLVCMRLELYGCVTTVEKVPDILSYSMPVGHRTKNGKSSFKDTSYNGVISKEVYEGGTGILTDGKFGPDDARQDKGEGWVGWFQDLTTSPYIDVTFEFSGVRKFKDVTLAVNVDKKRSFTVFNKSEIFFASTSDGFSDTSFLQFCPKQIPDRYAPYYENVTLPLCENMAKFIKLRLYLGGRGLFITEIIFNSVPVESENEKTSLQDCMKDACMMKTQSSPTSSPVVPFTTFSTSTSECNNCPTGTNEPANISSDSNNLQMTITVICVVMLILILLLVIIFLLYRRRVLCFSKIKQSKNMKDQDGEVPMDGRSPDASHQGFLVNDETAPYEEVSNSPQSGYAELKGNRKGGKTSDNNYQNLLKSSSDYAMPADPGEESSYEEVPNSSSPVYTELNKNRKDENENDKTYQKLLKRDSDYVIPNDGDGEHSYEEVGKKKSPPGYTDLNETKRVKDDDEAYQKLVKK